MGRYRRVSSYKIMNDYKSTVKHLQYISVMANTKNKRFFRINSDKIEKNILQSKLTNSEKNTLLLMINKKDYHQIYCYSNILIKKYQKKYINYANRMDELFMTIEDKTVFYA